MEGRGRPAIGPAGRSQTRVGHGHGRWGGHKRNTENKVGQRKTNDRGGHGSPVSHEAGAGARPTPSHPHQRFSHEHIGTRACKSGGSEEGSQQLWDQPWGPLGDALEGTRVT